MAPRPDHPADDPSPDGDESDAARADRSAEVSDEQWAAIVADLQGGADLTGPSTSGATAQDGPRTSSGPAVTYPVAPWVTDSRVVRPARSAGDGAGPGGEGDRAAGLPGGATGRDWDATEQIDEAERRVDDAEHFVPPDPGPVLGGDPLLTMAWLAVGGMPLLWLVVLLGWRGAPAALVQASVAVFLLGVVVLLWRMPHRRDDDHDDADGAVV
ncbi:hypothetical protein [Cellulomonas sp. C5510]|uniref:hypothetical protein n=1 Tax=Cellulomonas sp. C5510 TaxID=2871170 RepID=UPI001C96E5BA|nr:hypothetical protein [Cellulomonas sp. C5510]QZN87133.1 hypothetical protein K5O09_08550 [Cellulomonas sp. C5510]